MLLRLRAAGLRLVDARSELAAAGGRARAAVPPEADTIIRR